MRAAAIDLSGQVDRHSDARAGNGERCRESILMRHFVNPRLIGCPMSPLVVLSAFSSAIFLGLALSYSIVGVAEAQEQAADAEAKKQEVLPGGVKPQSEECDKLTKRRSEGAVLSPDEGVSIVKCYDPTFNFKGLDGNVLAYDGFEGKLSRDQLIQESWWDIQIFPKRFEGES